MKELIDQTLDSLLPEDSPFYPSLIEAARHALLAPAKRIRPLLVLHAAEMIEQGSAARALHPACALELVHTYSLIHDDLPCMDDDDWRRGRPTVHKLYGEGRAVLVGDYLLTYAFEVLADAPNLIPEQKIELVKSLALASGSQGMIGGQVMDIEKASDIDTLHQKKTGALFECALRFAGVITQSDYLYELTLFGLQFGHFFQIVDDLLDEDHPEGSAQGLDRFECIKKEMVTTLESLPFDASQLYGLIELVDRSLPAPLYSPA